MKGKSLAAAWDGTHRGMLVEKEGVEPSGPGVRSGPECDRTLRCLRLFSVYALRNCTGHPGDRDEPLLTGCGLWIGEGITYEPEGRGRVKRPSDGERGDVTKAISLSAAPYGPPGREECREEYYGLYGRLDLILCPDFCLHAKNRCSLPDWGVEVFRL